MGTISKKNKNSVYLKEFKSLTINRILINNKTPKQVAINIGLASDGILRNWLFKF